MTIWTDAGRWSSRPEVRPVASTSRFRPTCSMPPGSTFSSDWDSQAAVEAFRGSGPDDVQTEMIVSAAVSDYHVSGERGLT